MLRPGRVRVIEYGSSSREARDYIVRSYLQDAESYIPDHVSQQPQVGSGIGESTGNKPSYPSPLAMCTRDLLSINSDMKLQRKTSHPLGSAYSGRGMEHYN